MSTSRLDIQSAVDRYANYSGRGMLFGFPTLAASCNMTTGVPTNGTQGWAPSAIWYNFKATSAGTMFYINVGTFASSTWLNIDGAIGAIGALGVTGVAAGYKVARGTTALDGTNPTPVTTGLSTVVAATLTLTDAGAPGVGTCLVTNLQTNWATGALSVNAWKPTGAGDCTLIASTGTETFSWIAVGT